MKKLSVLLMIIAITVVGLAGCAMCSAHSPAAPWPGCCSNSPHRPVNPNCEYSGILLARSLRSHSPHRSETINSCLPPAFQGRSLSRLL